MLTNQEILNIIDPDGCIRAHGGVGALICGFRAAEDHQRTQLEELARIVNVSEFTLPQLIESYLAIRERFILLQNASHEHPKIKHLEAQVKGLQEDNRLLTNKLSCMTLGEFARMYADKYNSNLS